MYFNFSRIALLALLGCGIILSGISKVYSGPVELPHTDLSPHIAPSLTITPDLDPISGQELQSSLFNLPQQSLNCCYID